MLCGISIDGLGAWLENALDLRPLIAAGPNPQAAKESVATVRDAHGVKVIEPVGRFKIVALTCGKTHRFDLSIGECTTN
jgi:hypothetical protein